MASSAAPSRWLLLAAASLAALPAWAAENGVALTPPLGWSTWLTCEAGGGGVCVHDYCNEKEVCEEAHFYFPALSSLSLPLSSSLSH